MLNEIFDMIKEQCGGDKKETIQYANEILEYMTESNNFINEFSNKIEEYADDYNRCLNCGEELQYKTTYESSEFQGCSVNETIHNKYCPNCGLID